jgi:hypothetical protein
MILLARTIDTRRVVHSNRSCIPSQAPPALSQSQASGSKRPPAEAAFQEENMIPFLEFIGLVAAFVVASWARLKFQNLWVRVLFFFIAVIAGHVVYLLLGLIWASMNPATYDVARTIGKNVWEVLGSTIVGAIAGFASSLPDLFRTTRKTK